MQLVVVGIDLASLIGARLGCKRWPCAAETSAKYKQTNVAIWQNYTSVHSHQVRHLMRPASENSLKTVKIMKIPGVTVSMT